MLQRTQMLKRTRRNTIGRRSMSIRLTRERLFLLFMCVKFLFFIFITESLFIVFSKERLFMLFKFKCTVYKVKLILYYFYTYF